MLSDFLNPTIIVTTAGFIILVLSVILHEVMHGFVALKFGDHTAENAGRLTLNPIPHIDPIGTIIFPLLSFVMTGNVYLAWAKPVPVNPLHFSDIKKGEIFVSAAGFLTNFGLAIIFALLFHLTIFLHVDPLIKFILFRGIYINLILGIFNLLPIPPLDGSKVLLAMLPYEQAREFQKLDRYGFLILMLLVYMGITGKILGILLPFFFTILQIR